MPQKNITKLSLHTKNLWDNLRFYDQLSLGYLWLTLLLVALSAESVPTKNRIVISHITASVIGVLLIHLTHSLSHTRRHRGVLIWIKPLRDWYPLFLFTFLFFGEFTHLANLVLPYWIEHYLIRFDYWIFGELPHQFLVRRMSPWVMELMAFAYLSYYPLILGVTGLYYLNPSISFADRRRKIPLLLRTNSSFNDLMNRICLTFYGCYILFMLLPARSPRHALNLDIDMTIAGGICLDAVTGIQHYVSVIGAAFPSSHVAVAWVTLSALRRNYPHLYWMFLPVVIGLTMSVFILQYHYVLDAIAGIVVAILVEITWNRLSMHKKQKQVKNLLHFPATEMEKNSIT